MKNFRAEGDRITEELVTWRRYLHAHAEIGLELPQTADFVEEKLQEMGVTPKRIGHSGVVVMLGQGEKLFFLRADSDGLPILEDTDLPFASKNGNMHACGHDFHTTALLGAVKILKEHESELKGRVMCLFQPGEETQTGALSMIEHGIFADEMPEAGMSLHVFPLDLCTVNSRPGYVCASSDMFTITVTGIGCHGAYAFQGVDPINIASHIVISLQEFQGREVSSNDNMVLTICAINGGDATNVFPNEVVMKGSLRTASNEVRAFGKQRIVEICDGVAKTFRGSAKVDFHGAGAVPMINDVELFHEVLPYVNSISGEDMYHDMVPITGSEDFAEFAALFPCVDFWIGTGSIEQGCVYPLHHPKIVFGEEALPRMAAIFATAAYNWLENHS
ncbi:M20 family metallopeptidase [Chakrabartyella piscis]|uniref:M20 metallopeptidase family protein n=1 Tax=Chakrabartyella piscis TaxID=2918914 RepID=UPI002958DB46|nr:M20 family metallopeptidase [Chakrabartyella piscis]